MMTLQVQPDHMGYADVVDALYVTFGDYPLNGTMGDIEEIGDNIAVFYGPQGELVGIEIYDFVENYGRPPMTLFIDAEKPFCVDIPSIQL